MSLIFRYLTRETCTTMFVITSILVLIFMSHQFVHYLSEAATGRLTSRAVFQMMCIQIPLLLGFMMPLGLFLGILLSYGRLYVDNEMTVLTACGVGRDQVFKMTLILALVVTGIVMIIMCWVEPAMAKFRHQIIANAASSSPIEKISPGRFQVIGNWVLYSEGISRNRQVMSQVFAADIPPSHKDVGSKYPPLNVVSSTKAFQKRFPTKESFIVLANGYRYRGIPGQNSYQIVQFDEYGVRLPYKAYKLGKREEFMSMWQLWHALRQGNHIASGEIQWRIAMPISVLILALFAVPLSEVKPRKGRFAQFLPAILIYITYTDLLFLGRVWIEKGNPLGHLGLWWIHGTMFLLAFGVIYFRMPEVIKRYEGVAAL